MGHKARPHVLLFVSLPLHFSFSVACYFIGSVWSFDDFLFITFCCLFYFSVFVVFAVFMSACSQFFIFIVYFRICVSSPSLSISLPPAHSLAPSLPPSLQPSLPPSVPPSSLCPSHSPFFPRSFSIHIDRSLGVCIYACMYV